MLLFWPNTSATCDRTHYIASCGLHSCCCCCCWTHAGNLRTNDGGGPYNLTLLPVQVNEVLAGIAAKKDFTDQVC